MFFHDILLILHLIGLAMGMGLGIANMFIARTAASSPPEAGGTLRALAPQLGRISTIGLGVLVVTGLLLMIWYASEIGLGLLFGRFWFWMKLLSAAGMVAIAYLIYQAQNEIRSGNLAAAGRMQMYGPAIGGLGLLTLIFSVFAFH